MHLAQNGNMSVVNVYKLPTPSNQTSIPTSNQNPERGRDLPSPLHFLLIFGGILKSYKAFSQLDTLPSQVCNFKYAFQKASKATLQFPLSAFPP